MGEKSANPGVALTPKITVCDKLNSFSNLYLKNPWEGTASFLDRDGPVSVCGSCKFTGKRAFRPMIIDQGSPDVWAGDVTSSYTAVVYNLM